ncbi:MAG: hypothetical protein AAF035_05895 [Pseudomonadota bacterium]
MDIRFSDQLLGRREPTPASRDQSLPQLARKIGFSDTEIAELERVYSRTGR